MNITYFNQLSSVKRNEVLSALYDLQGSDEKELAPNTLEKVLNLLDHTDSDIREQAVNLVGIHFRSAASYQLLINMIEGKEKDQAVLIVICDAIGALVSNGSGDLKQSSSALARVALNSLLDPELRGAAYLSLKRINNQISLNEFASSSRDIEELDYDEEWLSNFN